MPPAALFINIRLFELEEEDDDELEEEDDDDDDPLYEIRDYNII